jgi:hypothetical protein
MFSISTKILRDDEKGQKLVRWGVNASKLTIG